MSTIISDQNSMEKCPSKIVDAKEPKEGSKNGLINGMVHKKKHMMNTNLKSDIVESHAEIISDLQNLEIVGEIHAEPSEGDLVNNVVKSKKRTKKKKHITQLDANENLNEPKIEENHNKSKNDSFSDKLGTDSNAIVETSASCSKTSYSNSDIDCEAVSSDLNNLAIKEESPERGKKEKIDFVPYESELQMPMIMKIIQKDLSEPYSIYTYRYFIHNWPKLCFLAMYDGQCVGAIVCKLDLHRKVVRRGYIAMLAVDQNYRKLRIGSTLVQMAIQEMTNGDADEVVLETEVTNKPALKLYEKLGFVRDKRLFRYYLNGVDALRLKLWLR
ncbi:unnamed protein product [Ceutorhynchus assimilis]|uniref:N-terminal methionine N(alpha)-acetyltransferase NatC n=1 Tax=Ceutorhynchus assimilis TaxID=467358 RepID=A0A9N9MCD2_9CUCU|nr:unnamed protein product [Ceutorhynchus assimilis]